MKRVLKMICSLVLAACITVGMYPMTAQAAIDAKEYCTPILKQYTTSGGTWKPSSDMRIYLAQENAPSDNIKSMMGVISEQFKEKGYATAQIPVLYGTSAAAKNTDILIVKGETGVPTSLKEGIQNQSYKIEIGTNVKITYKSEVGIFYAFTTMLQVLTYTGGTLPCGEIIDYPDTEIRAAQIDIARKYYTPEWLKNYIKELSWLKYNEITFHISEDQGMRLESKTYPGYAGSRLLQTYINAKITDPDAGKFLTQEQMADIVKTAFQYQLDVVPSFDSPGHMNYLLGKHYEKTNTNLGNSFTYGGKTYQPSISEYRVRAIDLSNAASRQFAMDFYNEFGKFFADLGCTKFNIGGDELFGWNKTELAGQTFFITGGVSSTTYKANWEANTHWAKYAQDTLKITNGTAYDTFISYMNEVADTLKTKYGYKTIRCFSDEIYHPAGSTNAHVSLNDDIEICFWSNATSYFEEFATFTANNRKLLNCIEDNAYYVLTVDDSKNKKSFDTLHPAMANGGEKIYNNWNSSTFYEAGATKYTSNVIATSSQYNVGSVFFIWGDTPWVETESEMIANLKPLIRTFSAKMWASNSNSNLTYSEFKTVYNKIGSAPLYGISATVAPVAPVRGDKQSTITVNYYISGTKTALTQSTSMTDYVGKPYDVIVPNIEEYSYIGCDGNLSGYYAENNMTINVYYVKVDRGSLKDYVDHFIPNDFVTADYGDYLNAWYAAKAVLEKSSATKEEVEKAIKDIKTITEGMKKKQVSITIIFRDTQGNELHASITKSVDVASDYDLSSEINAVTEKLGRSNFKYVQGSVAGYISATPKTVIITY